MAVVLCNRLPQPDTAYTACLVNLEGQYGELPVTPPVAVTVLDDDRCVGLMEDFIAARPELWHEDIGEAP